MQHQNRHCAASLLNSVKKGRQSCRYSKTKPVINNALKCFPLLEESSSMLQCKPAYGVGPLDARASNPSAEKTII